jgi:hypothetical protein
MAETVIDVHDLPEKDVKVLQRLVELFRKRRLKEASGREETSGNDIELGTHPSDVIGSLTRREIYDYL